jgi:tetratricopeptide (TPR) repeat protein
VTALRSGNGEQAAALLRRADIANDPLIRYYLAMAEEATGNLEEAKKLYLEVSRWNFNSIGFALVRSEAAEHAAALTPKESGSPARECSVNSEEITPPS